MGTSSLPSQVPMGEPNGDLPPTRSKIPNAPEKDKINDGLFNHVFPGAHVEAKWLPTTS